MTPITERDIRRAIKYWIKVLRLSHWQFKIEIGSDNIDEDNEAELATPADYNFATMRISKDWPNWDTGHMNEIVVHELVHAHTHQLIVAAESANEAFGAEGRHFYKKRLKHELEQTVDAITLVVLGMWEGVDVDDLVR
jgi:hypothetical protein